MKNRASSVLYSLVLAVMASVATLPTSAFGQDDVDLASLDLEDLIRVKVQTVFGASRFHQKVTEAPAAVSVVTANEIRAYGYRTLGDILRQAGGFTVNYDRNYSYVGVRGFQRPGDYNSRILVLVDSHRVNESIYDMAFVGTEFPVDIEMIEKVEVIRGATSSIYGTNAFLAVVNVITKKGHDLDGVRGLADVGTLGNRKALVAFGRSFETGVDVQMSGSVYRSAGQRRLYFKEFDTPATNNGIAENVDGDRSERFLSSVSLKGFTLQTVYGSRKKTVPTGAYQTTFNDPDFQTTDTRAFADLRYDRTIGKATYLTSRVYYDLYDYKGYYPGEPLYYDYANGKSWGAEIGLEKRLFQKHRITAGAEYRDNYSQKQGGAYVSPDEPVFEDRRSSRVLAGYIENEFSIHKSLILNMGVRHDRYDEFGGTTNPRLGLIYAPGENTALKFLWGTAFRAPNAYEMFYYNERLRPGSSSLEPETIRTGEVSFEKYISERYRFSVNINKSRIRSLIALSADSEGDRVFKNVGAADTQGAGLEFEARWRSGIGLRAVYSYHQTKDPATGSPLVHSVKHLVSGNLLIPVIPRKLLAGLDIQYVGPAKTLTGDFVDSFVVPNLTLSTPALPGGVDFSASIYNIFNSRYAHPGSEEHLQRTIPQDGRTFRLQLGYSWPRK